MLILDSREHIFLFLHPNFIPFLDYFLDLLKCAVILIVEGWLLLVGGLEEIGYQGIFAFHWSVNTFFKGKVLQHIRGFNLFRKTTRICFAS